MLPLVAACDGGVHAAGRQDVLVLELGGNRPSLRQDLLARGIPVALPHPVRAVDPVPPPVIEQPEDRPRDEREPHNGEQPDTPPVPGPQVEPPAPQPSGYRTVKLKRGQTLMHLSKEHFGTTRRWKEIMALNGWTEAQVNRLPADQDVKLPVDGGSVQPPR
ncbi:MAG: hypothetical protein RL398_3542 [Planctomycetota bacterium]|jgi:hypothetical protein